MKRVGLIAGTVFYGLDLFAEAEAMEVKTPFGPAKVVLTERVVYVPRHGLDPENYILPHRINQAANLWAIKSFGVEEVVGVNSSGSLRKSLTPGSILVPHDFISFGDTATAVTNRPVHITPHISPEVRRRLLEAAARAGVKVVDGGVYWQTRGPRLETRAEIELIRNFADVVGMTLGGEVTVAEELSLKYGALCSVDNYGHGLAKPVLTDEEIRTGARANSERMLAIFERLLEDSFGS